MELEVKHNNQNKFYIELGREEAHVEYSKSNQEINFTHTYVPEKNRGQGLAETIAEKALSFAKENNLKVIATCRFISSYIKRHKEYQELVQ